MDMEFEPRKNVQGCCETCECPRLRAVVEAYGAVKFETIESDIDSFHILYKYSENEDEREDKLVELAKGTIDQLEEKLLDII